MAEQLCSNPWQNNFVDNLKSTFEHIELPAKLLGYFLRSNKSNINQGKIWDHPSKMTQE